MEKWVHPFEKAGHGLAPFKCVGVNEKWHALPGGYRQPGSSCDYCGTGIAYEYWIKSADERKFKVGCECVRKTKAQVEGFKQVRTEFVRMKREAGRKAHYEALRAKWAVEAQSRRVAFDAENPGLYEALKGMEGSFFQSLAAGIEKYGSLTPNQLAAVKRILAEKQEKAELGASSEYVGQVKEKLSGEFTVKMYRAYTSKFYPYPASYFHILSMGGNLFVYKGSTALGAKGTVVKATFTIKEHSEYQGTKQTVLSRPKEVEVIKEGE